MAFTSLSESTSFDDLIWELQVRQDLSSAQSFDATSIPAIISSMESVVMSSSVEDATPTSFAASSDIPESAPVPTSTATSIVDTPTSTPQNTPIPTTTPTSTVAQTSAPESTQQGPTTAPARTTVASVFSNGLGTTRSGGTLIVATTNSRGQTTTLMGADASSATRKVLTSALFSTSQSLTTFRTTRVVDGSTSVGDATSSMPVTLSTGVVTGTNAAELAGGARSGGSSLDAQDKRIIGGVVGGVGGALLIGGILLVLWRLRKKKNDGYNDEYDYPKNEYAEEQRRINQGGQEAFSNGLERYHNPANPANTTVNTGSNF